MYIVRSSLLTLLLLALPICGVGHSQEGTNYSSAGAKNYAQSKHGADGALFLDPFFQPFLEQVNNEIVLDAGCGAGPWSIFAARNGAKQVYGIDIQQAMIDLAKKNAADTGIQNIEFVVGSVAQLPYADNFFDRAVSINVGCNLPEEVFRAHFAQLHRVLKKGGKLVITAPAHFDTVFTDDVRFDMRTIDTVIGDIKPDAQEIITKLAVLKSVLRAAFVVRNEKLVLVHDEKELTEGEAIWRKIPGLVVPNFYHSENAYVKQLLKAGFTIERIDRPHFPSWAEWNQSAIKLGQEYSYYHPFVILHATKP